MTIRAALTAVLVLTVLAFAGASSQTGGGCPKGSMDKAFFQSIKASNFAPPSSPSADEVALVLLDCLASPDPELRDTLAYDIVGRWIRRGVLKPDTMKRMAQSLEPNLKLGLGEAGTPTVFRRTFSALVLADLVSQDNRAPYLEASAVKALLEAALAYLPSERDLRGYDNQLGWMHGVAHGSDLLFRLAQSKHVETKDLPRVLEAVASKVAPTGEHFYNFGEDERLARPVIAVLARGAPSAKDWSEWIERRVMNPAPLGSWDDAYSSTAGLAKRHNTKLFLLSLNLYLTLGGASNAKDLLPAVNTALERLP